MISVIYYKLLTVSVCCTLNVSSIGISQLSDSSLAFQKEAQTSEGADLAIYTESIPEALMISMNVRKRNSTG